jgi:hypothetical protein
MDEEMESDFKKVLDYVDNANNIMVKRDEKKNKRQNWRFLKLQQIKKQDFIFKHRILMMDSLYEYIKEFGHDRFCKFQLEQIKKLLENISIKKIYTRI